MEKTMKRNYLLYLFIYSQIKNEPEVESESTER